MAEARFEMNRGGVREVFRSPGMQAAVLEAAQGLADEACARADPASLGLREFARPPFAAHADVLRGTAVGAAHTNGKMGRLHEARFQTLESVNH